MFLTGLKQVLRTQGVTCGELATMTGISKTHISRLSSLSSGTTRDTVIKLSDALDVSVDSLVHKPNVYELIAKVLDEIKAYKDLSERVLQEHGIVMHDITKQHPSPDR